MIRIKAILIILIAGLIFFSCTDPYALTTEAFQDSIVIEANLTNELKNHQVKLSRTTLLEDEDIMPETGANVQVVVSDGTIYAFSEMQSGQYESDLVFQAVSGVSYHLEVTAQGKSYRSSEVELPTLAQIDNVYAEVATVDEEDGVQIYIDTNNGLGDAKYFRYEFEETYKIVTPYTSVFDAAIATLGNEYSVILTPKTEQQTICYSTNYSTGINQTSTSGLSNDVIERFPIHFMDSQESKLRERYSIVVKQHVQSESAYIYYKTIKDLSTDDGVFSDNQTGFIQGNISSVDNAEELVVGFFDLSSVYESNRIYFNAADFGYSQPPYFYECDYLVLDYDDNSTIDGDLNERVRLRGVLTQPFYPYEYLTHAGNVYEVVTGECANCTTFSSNIMPTFWID